MRPLVAWLIFAVMAAVPLDAKDWYVKEGAKGDGSKTKPFGAIEEALGKAFRGDVIHVVAGTYSGKLGVGYVVISSPGITLVGGYKDAAFSERNPFLYPTFISARPGSGAWKFNGPYIRTRGNHESTTIDGFWFDRRSENAYDKENNLLVTSSNLAPILWLESPDCHVRNCVFLNSAQVSVRMAGDGSSVTNSLFAGSSHVTLDLLGKGRRIGKGYPYARIRVAGNTFLGQWQSVMGAAAFLWIKNQVSLTIENNLFAYSQAYAARDLVNFEAERRHVVKNNAFHKMAVGLYYFFDKENNASLVAKTVEDLKKVPLLETTGNDIADPGLKLDPTFLASIDRAAPKKEPKKEKKKDDDEEELEDDITKVEKKPAGKGLGMPYPIDHVRTGALWTTSSEAAKGRGLDAKGPFPVVRAALLGPGPDRSEEKQPKRDYQKVTFEELREKGDQYEDKAVEFKAWWAKTDRGYEYWGAGGKKIPYVKDTNATTHVIFSLRPVPEWKRGVLPFKGYVRRGSAAERYWKKRAARPAPSGTSYKSFVVRGVLVKPAPGTKLFGKGARIILIDSLSAN